MIKKILLVGPQASGKGTQAQMLSQKFDIPIFSTGNILRQKIQSQDKLGKELSEIVNRGELAPDNLVNQVITEKIKTDGVKGYILDGYPRNIFQAEYLSKLDKLTHVIEIHIADATTIKRVAGRRTCPKCQTVYNLATNPPKNKDICDHDNAKLIIRADETEMALKQRLATYHESTKPLLDFYKNKGILYKINGEKSIPDVSNDIIKILE